MIADDTELAATIDRAVWMQRQVALLRRTEANPVNYRAASGGFLLEIERMHRAVHEYLSLHPADAGGAA